MSHNKIIQYYIQCENAYKDAWGLRMNQQLNLGLWKKNTKSLREAMHQLNVEIARLAEIRESSIVLDAGCGVGGTSIYLNSEFGATVYGIGIVQSQIEQCRNNALKAGVADKVQYQIMDYCETTFPNNFFDAVIGIESICHADSKSKFLRESHRILKKGGRLVIADPLQKRGQLSFEEKETLYSHSFNGCAVWELWTKNQYLSELNRLNFIQVDYQDRTENIRPSIRRLRRLYYPASLYNYYRSILGKPVGEIQHANTRMCFYLMTALNRGLWSYGLIKAIKKE